MLPRADPADSQLRLANKLYLKVADLAALDADYYKAIQNYEKVAKASLNNNLMKWSVKEYYLKAGICHLATNVCELEQTEYIINHDSRTW